MCLTNGIMSGRFVGHNAGKTYSDHYVNHCLQLSIAWAYEAWRGNHKIFVVKGKYHSAAYNSYHLRGGRHGGRRFGIWVRGGGAARQHAGGGMRVGAVVGEEDAEGVGGHEARGGVEDGELVRVRAQQAQQRALPG